MIIVNLSGGLGNQMFQYAFGKAIEIKYGFKLKLDANYYFSRQCIESEVPRKYLLDKFNIKTELASLKEVKKLNPIYKKIIRKIKLRLFGPSNAFAYIENEIKNNDNQYYIGFWQNEKYFIDIRQILINEFTLSSRSTKIFDDFLNQINQNTNSVSVHIRRTDILNPKNPYREICDKKYFDKSMEIMKGKIDNPTFFIFSDDIEWCKENIKNNGNTIFVSNDETKDYEELILMSKCKHNIIANSSFSWWGAWLNTNPEKIIIGPKKWLDIPEKEYADVLPNNWIKI